MICQYEILLCICTLASVSNDVHMKPLNNICLLCMPSYAKLHGKCDNNNNNNGNFGTSQFWYNFTVIQRLSSFEVKLYCYGPVGTTELVLYGEVNTTVSFIQSELKEKFHCI